MKFLTEIIVSHHKSECEPYLNLALESLISQSVEPKVSVISSCEITQEIKDKYTGFKFVIDPNLDNASKKVEYFLDHLSPDTEMTALMSNDVYLSKDSVWEMETLSTALNHSAILAPLSNNEAGSRYVSRIPFNKQNYDASEVDLQFLRNYSPKFEVHFRVPWISFICPFISVKLWKHLGRLDMALDRSHNDVDFCLRAAKHHIPTFVNTNAYALHFGSKTMGTGKDTSKEQAHFESKHSLLDIVHAIM